MSMALSHDVDGGDGPQIRLTVNILNNQSWTADKGDPPACGLGVKLTSHCKN
jgi:hypothetical protein